MENEGTIKVSLIHPDMYNRMIKRNRIEGVEVIEEDGDLKLHVEDGCERKVINDLLNVALQHDITVSMVVDSNTHRINDVVNDMKQITGQPSWYDKTDIIEAMEQDWEILEGIHDNLSSVVSDYRERGAL